MTVSGPCAVHPEREARDAPCARCGSFLCDACFADGHSLICGHCQGIEDTEAREASLQKAQAGPTRIAARMLMIGSGLGLANVAYGLATGHYFTIVFPVAGVLLGMSLAVLSFALFGPPKNVASQRVRGLVFVCMTLAGLLAGIALTWLVRD